MKRRRFPKKSNLIKEPGREVVCEQCGLGPRQRITLLAAGPRGKARKYYCPFHHPNTKFVK